VHPTASVTNDNHEAGFPVSEPYVIFSAGIMWIEYTT